MHTVVRRLAVCLVLAIAGCSPNRPYNGVAGPGADALERATLGESLFPEDQAVLGNEELKTILASPVVLPERAKLAVVRFGRMPYWWGWSEEFVRTNEQIDNQFLGTLRRSARLREVAYLPSLVMPPVRTVPHVRQAAARLQADLVLIYRTSTSNYGQQKWFRAKRTRAYSTVEAVLLDTRTGVIPFSTVVSERFAAAESKKDYGFDETVARAEQQAIGRAWQRLAAEAVAFLDSAERR
jgi:hypothetical protein